jgi:rhodanese-related sulfurtransferase
VDEDPVEGRCDHAVRQCPGRAGVVGLDEADAGDEALTVAPFARADVDAGRVRRRDSEGADRESVESVGPASELRAIYQQEHGLRPGDDTIVYCRIGERSSHSWFALSYLLGYGSVRNYDGSWTEWGNGVGLPIERP